jgi:MFS family permease
VGFRRVLAASLLGAGASLLLMPLAPGVPALAAVGVGYAALQGATQAMVFSLLAVEVAPERRSATLNLVLLPLYVAGIIGPTIGAAAAGVGGVAAPFVAAGIVFLAGGAVVAAALRPRQGTGTGPGESLP